MEVIYRGNVFLLRSFRYAYRRYAYKKHVDVYSNDADGNIHILINKCKAQVQYDHV